MKRFHIAIATRDIAQSVRDYTTRLGSEPSITIDGQYALWRTDILNFSVRYDATCRPGELRHLGWEDPEAERFSESTDINGILWERFTAQQQAAELDDIWPGSGYSPTN